MPVFANGEKEAALLKDTMRRVGARMSRQEFLFIVSNIYHAFESKNYKPWSGVYNDLKEALKQCKEHLFAPITILNVGCCAGYEAEVVREVFDSVDVRRIVLTDISPEMVRRARTRLAALYSQIEFRIGNIEDPSIGLFELVITHNLIHRIADLPRFFRTVSKVTLPGCYYLMGDEPSIRFYRNPECLAVYQEMRTIEERRKWADPRMWVDKLRRMIRPSEKEKGLFRRINDRLRSQFGFTDDLTPREIVKLLHIHSPSNLPKDLHIDFDGFDWNELHRSYLQDFELVQVWTSDDMGGTNPSELPLRWQQLNDALREKYPIDGSNFTVLWKRRAL